MAVLPCADNAIIGDIVDAVRLDKRLERMRHSTRSVDPDEADSILKAMGFTRRPGKGDHRVYSHPDLARNLVIDPRRPLLPVYVRNIIKAIEEVAE